ncbi:MAG: DNA primase [Candidatus Yanofskybacteria bacterium RIFCSPHIGHO2_01_FULL_39_8b]|uniref:DNA primase n=1 Tax=Candidatus Yanofskybacteria bacterium RIFCSPHIGHO2_01_FULL_39_8b TaxID=1802659 RepID=A0A1F8E8E1_9BACT|nr:MAG: DNA primase [Candidatus Yanofskybacteria bacterium RIFCSPHIGHO2_01_FULL_39_8b]
MSDNVSQIKDRLSVVDIISGYIKVQKAGMNFKARCPFHNEKTPSFYISPERQIWHCFGCQKGGDIFGFVKEMEGVEFPEALRILAQKAGIKLESYNPAVQDAKTVFYDICETSARFFEKQLHHSEAGKKAKAYLTERGLIESTIKDFRLGFAPEGWHNLGQFLHDCGFKDEDMVNSGMTIKRDDNSGTYDRFRSRIMFPITDINDQIIGFTGRVFGDNHPVDVGKYINSPQTLIYDKSRVLYGFNMAKAEVRREDRCLLVEGNMDAIMSYQAGVKNVAATSGTALTPSHLQLLQRYTNNLDFCFDTDAAGLVATRRGLGLALSQNLNVKIVHLNDPDCKDPADYVKKFARLPDEHGQKWQEFVRLSKPVIDFYFDKLKSELDFTSVDGKKAIIASLGPLIKRISSEVEKSHWISKLATILRTREDAIESDILTAKDDLELYAGHKYDSPEQPGITKPTEENIFEEALLALIIKKPALFYKEIKNLKTNFMNPEITLVIKTLGDSVDLQNFKFESFVNSFDESTKMKLEFASLKAQETLKEFTDDQLMADFLNIKKELEKRSIKSELADLEFDIKSTEQAEDKSQLQSLLIKVNELNKKLNIS